MNPQNVGENIPLKHSSLWRKPLLYEKQQKHLPQCHLQLNIMGAMGQSWRTRNNAIHTSTDLPKSRPKTGLPRQKLKDNNTRAHGEDGQCSQKSTKLVGSMVLLRKQEEGRVRVAAYPAIGKYGWVMNDYHSRLVNPGYSRNVKGKHFTS